MLASLLNIPKSPEDWAEWSMHHSKNHDDIRQAISAQYTKNLIQYLLDPVPQDPPEISSWLQRNQTSHNDMNSVLLLSGTDLESVDFSNEQQLAAWIYLHYQEHLSANISLRI